MKPIEEKFEQMSKATPDLPLHRAHLRRVLLASKPEGSTFSLMKKLLPVGLAFAFLIMFNAVQSPDSTIDLTPTAGAQELVADTIAKIQTLTTEELQALEDKIGADEIFNYLLSAQSSSDLSFTSVENLTCEVSIQLQAEQNLPVLMAWIPEGGWDAYRNTHYPKDTDVLLNTSELFDPYDTANCRNPLLLETGTYSMILDDYEGFWNELTYVGFTNEEGHSMVLGVGDDLMPGFMLDISDNEETLRFKMDTSIN